jgi:hypothetical protein
MKSGELWLQTLTSRTRVPQGSTASRPFASDIHREPRRFRYQDGLPRLNHEEAMRCVALELFDQAIFPIEIGLHRMGPDAGALVGTPVAM